MSGPVTAPAALILTPNPAADAAAVCYELPTAAVTIQNLLGETGRTLPAQSKPAGLQSQPLFAAGVYLVRLQAGDATQTTRLVVE